MNLLFKEYLAVAVGGAFGSMLRFLVSRSIQTIHHLSGWPLGILVVNISGSLVMGMMYGLLVHRLTMGPLWRAAILVGILGGYTTFSSFSMDTLLLLQSGNLMAAAANILLSLLFCLCATWLGVFLSQLIF